MPDIQSIQSFPHSLLTDKRVDVEDSGFVLPQGESTVKLVYSTCDESPQASFLFSLIAVYQSQLNFDVVSESAVGF